jgi:hypothetical protein
LKFSSKDRNVHLELPVKIEFEGKVYWIKRATKTSGIYMNNIPCKEELPKEKNNDKKV